jgi:hypothetical protein
LHKKKREKQMVTPCENNHVFNKLPSPQKTGHTTVVIAVCDAISGTLPQTPAVFAKKARLKPSPTRITFQAVGKRGNGVGPDCPTCSTGGTLTPFVMP